MSDVRFPMSEIRRSTGELFNSLCHRPTQKHTEKGIFYPFCVLLWVLWLIIFAANSVSWLTNLGASAASGRPDLWPFRPPTSDLRPPTSDPWFRRSCCQVAF